MKQLYCDGCGTQLVSATEYEFYHYRKAKLGGYNLSKEVADLCNSCLHYIRAESDEAMQRLKADPEKYKKKYEF